MHVAQLQRADGVRSASLPDTAEAWTRSRDAIAQITSEHAGISLPRRAAWFGAPSGFVRMLNRDDDIALFASCVDIPVRVSYPVQGIAAIDDRSKRSCLDKLKHKGQIFILRAYGPQTCEDNLCLLAPELRRPEHLPQNRGREDG